MTGLTNNENVVRTVIVAALSLGLQVAALSAPLVHAHPDDHATEHHAGRAVHTHWTGHAGPHGSSTTPALRTDDHDRAVYLTAFVAVAAAWHPVVGVSDGIVELPVPSERAAHRVVEILHSHDPPFFSSRSPRAPPSFLS